MPQQQAQQSGFTPREMQIIEWGKENNKSKEETWRALTSFRMNQDTQRLNEFEPADRSTFRESFVPGTLGIGRRVDRFTETVKDVPDNLRQTFDGMVSHVDRGREGAQRAREENAQGNISRGAATADVMGSGFSAGLGIVGEAMVGLGKLPLHPETEEKIGGWVETGATKLVESTPVQAGMQFYYSSSPETQAWMRGGVGVAEGMTAMFGVPWTSKLLAQGQAAARRGMQTKIDSMKDSVRTRMPWWGDSGGGGTGGSGGGGTGGSGGGGTGTFANARGRVRNYMEDMNITLRRANRQNETASQTLARRYYESFVQDNTAMSTQVQNIARNRYITDEVTGQSRPMTGDELLERVAATSRAVPEIRGEKAHFEGELRRIEAEKQALWNNQIEPRINSIQNEFSWDSIELTFERALRGQYADVDGLRIRGVRPGDADKAVNEMRNIVRSYRNTWGDGPITARQLRDIQSDMNSASGAFNRPHIEIDTEEAIASTIRRVFDQLDETGEIAQFNQQYARLRESEQVLGQFRNQTIAIPYLTGAGGRYLGTIGLGVGSGMIGAGFATGAGGLVIAGVAASLGQRGVTYLWQRMRFNNRLKRETEAEFRQNRPFQEEVFRDAPGFESRLDLDSPPGGDVGGLPPNQ